MPDVRRRDLIGLLGGAAVAWPSAARAQQSAKLQTIGFLGPTTPSSQSQHLAAFVQRLRELGWIEGRDVAIEDRWAEGRDERYTTRCGGGEEGVVVSQVHAGCDYERQQGFRHGPVLAQNVQGGLETGTGAFDHRFR